MCCMHDTCLHCPQALLLQHVEGRELGPALMEPLLRLMQTAVLWRQHAALTAHEDDDVNAFVEVRLVSAVVDGRDAAGWEAAYR